MDTEVKNWLDFAKRDLDVAKHLNTAFYPKLHSAAPNGSWCGDQRQLSAANGSLN